MTETARDFGAVLRHAREQSGRSLRQMADSTKLSVRAFEALERNRIDQLPGGIYRRAIVRAYASEIGLDAEQTLRAFLVLYPDEVPTAVHVTAAAPRRSAWRGLLGVLGAIVPVIAGAFYFMQPVIQAPLPVGAEPGRPPARETVPVNEAAHVAYEQSPVLITLSISAPVYLEITAGDRPVLARAVEPGETVRVELSSDVTLTGSDAHAIQFSINGRAGRSLGAKGTPLAVRIDRETYEDWLIKP